MATWLARLACLMRSPRMLAGLVLAAFSGVYSSAVIAEGDLIACQAPAPATRIAPRNVEPQSFVGVIAEGAGPQEVNIQIPAGAYMEFEIVVRRTNLVANRTGNDAPPWALGLYIGQGDKAEQVSLIWDKAPWLFEQGNVEVTERARGTTYFPSRLNISARIRLRSFEGELTYIIRAWPSFYGDAGTRLDAGARAETAFPITPGTLVEGNLASLRPSGPGLEYSGTEAAPAAGPSYNDLVMATGPGPVSVDIDEDYGEFAPVADEILPLEDPVEIKDQSEPVLDWAFVDDFTDIYRLRGVPAGSKIAVRLVASEELRTRYAGLRQPSENRVGWPTVDILKPGCDANGNFILMEADPNSSWDVSQYAEYLTQRDGDFFVRVTGGDAWKYWLRAEFESVGLPFIMEPPYFELSAQHLPKDPTINAAVSMGFRLRNLPDFKATGATVQFQFLDAKSRQPIENVQSVDDRCTAATVGSFACDYGDIAWGGHEDSLFSTILPRDGILWLASWDSDDGAGGNTSAHGWIGRDAKPAIQDVFPFANQTGALYGLPSYPYPFVTWGRPGPNYRTLFITGWKLPQKSGDEMVLSSSDGSVEYRYVAFPDSENSFYREMYQEGWARYRKARNLSPSSEIPAGLDGLIVRANLGEGILPGFKEIALNGAKAPWELQFGGIEAGIRFVHAGDRLAAANAYIPETIEAVVEVNVPLPLEAIDLIVYEDWRNRPGARVHKIRAIAERNDDLRVQRFVTPPIVIAGSGSAGAGHPTAGQLVINADNGANGPVRLRAEIDPNFRARYFALPMLPGMARIGVLASPMDEAIAIGLGAQAGSGPQSLFHLALRRAAACRGITVADWDGLNLQDTEVDYFWNVVLLTLFDEDFRTEKVTVGHLAATLLLREMFVNNLDRIIRKLSAIEAQDEEVLGILKRMTVRFSDRSFPINRIKVTLPDGIEIDYGYAVANDNHASFAREYGFGSGPEAEARAFEWRLQATREALAKLKLQTQEMRDDVRALDSCNDIEELVRITGSGFGVVRAALSPKLRRLVFDPPADGRPGWSEWKNDTDAQFWVREVEQLLTRVKNQEAAANRDTDQLVALTSLLAVPVTAGAGGSAAYVAFAFSMLDLSVTTWTEVRTYIRSQQELDFSEKAGIVLGFERNKAAEREAKAFGQVLFNVGISALFAGLDAADAIRAIRAAKPIIRGMNVTRSLRERGITTLSEIERRNFATFAMRSKLRQLQVGTGNLADLERRALEEVEALIERRTDSALQPVSRSDLTTAPVVEARTLDLVLGPGGKPVIRPVADPIVGTPEAFVAVPRGPPQDINPAQMLVDQIVTQDGALTLEAGSHAGSNFTARDVGHYVSGKEITFDVAGKERTIQVGEFIGGGATSAAYTSTVKTPMGRETVGRLTFDAGGHRAATSDAYGAGIIKRVNSPNLRLPEIVDSFDVRGVSAADIPILRIQFVERIETAEELIKRLGELSEAHLKVMNDAIRDMNDAGYAWLDMKWDNFGFATTDGKLQMVIFDTGGIVRTIDGNKEWARQLQLLVNGPYLQTFPNYPKLIGNNGFRTGVRKTEILERFAERVDFDDMAGIDNWAQLGFTPAGGEQLEGFGARLTKE